MTEHVLTESAIEEQELITFGTPDKKITIDVTFIPASTAYRMMKFLVRDPQTNRFSDEAFAKTLTIFTNEVDAAWIVENLSYRTLDDIVTILIRKAFGEKSEKN